MKYVITSKYLYFYARGCDEFYLPLTKRFDPHYNQANDKKISDCETNVQA